MHSNNFAKPLLLALIVCSFGRCLKGQNSAPPPTATNTASPSQIKADPRQKAICQSFHSMYITGQCNDLAIELSDMTSMKTGHPNLNLTEPSVLVFRYFTSINAVAFNKMIGGTVQQDLQTDLPPLLQSALNDAAQLVSTKEAVNQTGANSTSSGSTSLVTKPTTTDLISLAAESGAFTDTVNGTTLTAQANVAGVARYLSGQEFASMSKSKVDILRHITLASTFNIAQSSSSNVQPSGSATATTPTISSVFLPSNNLTFSSLSANFTLYRPYSPDSSKFKSAWATALKANSDALAKALKAADVAIEASQSDTQKVMSDPNVQKALDNWIKASNVDEKSTPQNFKKFVADYKTWVDVFTGAFLKQSDPKKIIAVNAALAALDDVNQTILDKARETLVTINYTYATPANKPATHAVSLVASYVWTNGSQITGNVNASWFASVPVGAVYGALQSYQASAEFDKPIGPRASPRAVFSAAGYGQYQYTGTVLNITAGNLAPGTNISLPGNAQVLLGGAGWLGVVQAKLVFNIGKGASVPVAFKWASQTDLLPNQGDWKGQFGFSYDLSALSSILTGK